jgi:hypothetical protein
VFFQYASDDSLTFITGFPGVIGCVDGTHVELITKDPIYFNRKKRFSINTMITVNSQEEIIHYCIGSPGSYHDARVLRRSGLPLLLSNLPADRHILGINDDIQ